MFYFGKKRTYKIDQKSLLQTALSIFFGSHWLTKLDCYDLLLQNVTKDYKNIGSQRVYSGPQGLAFCSGNSDQDG
jgi:hypothetical protein